MDLKTYGIRESLRTLNIPMLVQCGRHDVQCPAAFSEEIHALVPGSRLVIFEESNHLPFVEEKDAFLRTVEELAVNARSFTARDADLSK